MMKYAWILLVVLTLVLIAQKVEAFGLQRPFGGRITTPVPGVLCPTGLAYTYVPVGPYPPTPFYFTNPLRQPTPGAWVLGLYSPVMKPLCGDAAGTPFPVFDVSIYGKSTF